MNDLDIKELRDRVDELRWELSKEEDRLFTAVMAREADRHEAHLTIKTYSFEDGTYGGFSLRRERVIQGSNGYLETMEVILLPPESIRDMKAQAEDHEALRSVWHWRGK